MRKEKLPPEEGKDKENGNYIVVDLSKITDKLFDGYERILIGRKFDGANDRKQGRLALPRFYATVGWIGILICSAILAGVTVAQKGIDLPMLVVFLVFIALGVALVLLGIYEIRYDENGFSTRLGKKVVRQYTWTEVTGVANYTTVYVNGKKLFVDHNLDGFGFFYENARAACKGKKGKTSPSEKKQKNRKKAGK